MSLSVFLHAGLEIKALTVDIKCWVDELMKQSSGSFSKYKPQNQKTTQTPGGK